ncbi:MAG TPA: hypothetical protein VFF78_05760, partial [Anaerolineaceae bacterium]|nr:hypothetical protein [Anaerolineaceae bacterium]
DPKSCLSANSSTSPAERLYHSLFFCAIIGTTLYTGILGILSLHNRPKQSKPNLMEVTLGRVINPEGASKERTRLCRAVVLSLRELMRQTEPGQSSRDLAAFIALALNETYQSIDTTVTAWEKRGYWVKADRFRMEWEWSSRLGDKMRAAVIADDWASIAVLSAQIGQKLMNVKLPLRHHLGTPWVGAWEKLPK